jgi:zinc transport system substrate-binding protein
LHQHGPAGEHSHQGTAFTTWLDPQLAIAQAKSVTNALIELAPSGEVDFRDNLAKLQKELMGIDERLIEVFARLDDRAVLFSHPVYQYLQRRFMINSQSVHWEPDEEPSTSDWIELQQKLSLHRATLMIWEDEPLASTVLRLSDVGIRSVVFHTMATRSDEGDYISVMTANADRIATALERLAL